MMHDLKESFFKWKCDLVKSYSPTGSYDRLLRYLDEVEFTWPANMSRDENRYIDGIDLRFRFGYEKKYDYNYIIDELGESFCSVLDMMVALALRCEEDIMSNSAAGDRVGKWFWEMVENLGLIDMTDDHFDYYVAEFVMDRFLNRKYKRNGQGGLVILNDDSKDTRTIEIWGQMMRYLSERVKRGEI